MANLQTIFYQMVLSILRDMQITSASPGHINHFIGVTGAATQIGTDEEINEAIKEIIENLGFDTDDSEDDLTGDDKRKSNLKLTEVARAGADPVDFIQQYAKRLVPVLLPLLVAAGMTDIVVNTMLSPGGLFDRRLRRIITQEVNGILDKQTQMNFSIGTRQLTIQSRAGFRNIMGIGTEDNLRQIREGTGAGLRKSQLDYIDMSKGVRDLTE